MDTYLAVLKGVKKVALMGKRTADQLECMSVVWTVDLTAFVSVSKTVGSMGLVMDTLMAVQTVASMEELMAWTWAYRKVALMVNMKAENLEHKMAVYLVIQTVVRWEHQKDHLQAACLEK